MSLFGDAERYIADYGYAAVALGIMLEDFGLPAPGETVLISGAVLAADGRLDITWLLVLAWASAVIGDNIGWAIGHYGGHLLVVRHGRTFGLTRAKLARVEGFFARYGDLVVVFARFVVLLRQLNGIVAGTLSMHWLRFLLLNAVGAALWVGWWGLLSYWLGRRVLDFVKSVGRIEPVLLVLAAIVLAGVGARIYWRRTRPGRG